MCVLSDHQPANHQEIERSVIGEIIEGIAVNTGNTKGYCAQAIISELEDQRAQLIDLKQTKNAKRGDLLIMKGWGRGGGVQSQILKKTID